MVLSTQIAWSENIESALTTISGGGDMKPMQGVLSNVEATLNVLADTVLMEQPPLRRRKLEHLVCGIFIIIIIICSYIFKGSKMLMKIKSLKFFSVLDHRIGAPT